MTIDRSTKRLRAPAGQSGAALVTSLLLLLVLTIIGVSVMKMTRMQERMSGNARDVNLAFQGAESGLRGGEGEILSFATAPAPCAAAPCTTVYGKDVLPAVNNANDKWWNDHAQEFEDANQGDDLAQAPQYVIEQLAFVPYSKEFGEITGRDFYQVSGRSTGGTDKAESVVQSTFARTAN